MTFHSRLDDQFPLFLEAIKKNNDLLQMVQYPYMLLMSMNIAKGLIMNHFQEG